MLKSALRALSPAGARARLSILIFHRVLPAPDALFPGEVDRRRFDDICGWLRRWFEVLPLDQAVARLRDGTLPARAASITFDDGYADNHDIALPILQRHGLPATFFIATGFLDGGRMWNDTVIESLRRTTANLLDLSGDADGLWRDDGSLPARFELSTMEARRQAIGSLLPALKYLPPAARERAVRHVATAAGAALPDDLMMRSDQVRALGRAGMQIGAHTVSHPILARLDRDAALGEMQQSRAALEAALDRPVPLFAYPNGKPGDDYTAQTVALAREAGFEAAVATSPGAAAAGTDLFQLPRFTPWDQSRTRFGLRMINNLRQPLS